MTGGKLLLHLLLHGEPPAPGLAGEDVLGRLAEIGWWVPPPERETDEVDDVLNDAQNGGLLKRQGRELAALNRTNTSTREKLQSMVEVMLNHFRVSVSLSRLQSYF